MNRLNTPTRDRLVCHPSGMKNELSFVSRSGGIAFAQPPANFCYPSGIKTNFAGGEIKAKDVNRTGGEVGRSSASAVFLFLLLFYCSTALYAPALAEPWAFREIPPQQPSHTSSSLCAPRVLCVYPFFASPGPRNRTASQKKIPKIAHTTGHFGVTCFASAWRTVSSPLNLEAAAFQPANSPRFRRSFNFHRSTKLAPDAC